MTQRELRELLDIDCESVAAHEAGAERTNAKLLVQIAKIGECAARLLLSRLHRSKLPLNRFFSVILLRRRARHVFRHNGHVGRRNDRVDTRRERVG
jgi:hypothetical protein